MAKKFIGPDQGFRVLAENPALQKLKADFNARKERADREIVERAARQAQARSERLAQMRASQSQEPLDLRARFKLPEVKTDG